ncbi:MAG: hypothetical protein V3T83_09895 [Acidobacteriota bacterium]
MVERSDTTGSRSNPILHPAYIALDLGEKAWELGFAIGLGQPARRRRLQADNREQLLKEVDRAKKRFGLPEGAEVLSCYEAGGEAFWVHRMNDLRAERDRPYLPLALSPPLSAKPRPHARSALRALDPSPAAVSLTSGLEGRSLALERVSK